MARPIGIDLFAGAGGLSLGFEQAGFDVKAAVEIDPVHCAVHKFNFPACAIIPRSIADVGGAEIRGQAGIGDAPVDVVFGGPPCQGFSLIGQRSLEDPRNRLVLEFVRIVAELGAKAFVFENVKGLTVGKHRGFLGEIIEAFEAAGYDVRKSWRVLDAADYGVPQRRERLILLGARKGCRMPDYPAPTTIAADANGDCGGLRRGPTCRDALGDLPNASDFAALRDSDEAAVAGLGLPSPYAAELRLLANAAWRFGHRRDWNPRRLTSSALTDHSEISRRRFAQTAPGAVEPISRFYKLDAKGLCNTLRAGTDGARGAFTSPRPIHFAYPRCVTVREMARLHGFPDWFRFNATKWHGARQIGNSVPPPLARAVAGEVMRALGREPEAPELTLSLGSPELLKMDLRTASRHFGVAKPRSKRDMKSGAKKRSQSQTEAARVSGANCQARL